MNRTDAQLVKEVLDGKTDSFGVLVRRYQGAVYGLAYYMIKSLEDAEDLAQEAFLQAYLELNQLREPSRFAGWLRRITANICNMWLRSHRIDHISLDSAREDRNMELISAKDELDPAREVERQELCETVLEAINSLSEKNRLAVTLFYMDGLSYRQISEFLEVPVTTIESRLHKARKKLKAEVMQMIEQDFNKNKPGSEFANKIVEGILEIRSSHGFVLQGEHRKDIIYVSPTLIMEYGLKSGDVIKGEARLGHRSGKGKLRHEMFEIKAVNDDENPARYDTVVEGILDIVPTPDHETEYGILRQAKNPEADTCKPLENDAYMSPSQIKKFGLKVGDVIEGIAVPPAPESMGIRYYALIYINKVNGEDPRE